MSNERQKYTPVMSADTDMAARHNPKGGPRPGRLHQRRSTETHGMRTAQVKTVNPVTGGDHSMRSRVYEKGQKNRTRS